MASPPILHVAGWTTCGFYRKTASVLTSLSLLFPNRLKVVEHSFADRNSFRTWLVDEGFRNHFAEARAKEHSASPFVWFSKTETQEPITADIEKYLGGHEDALNWCRVNFNPNSSATSSVDREKSIMVDDGYKKDHGYDYDLVVIGGGSGGMAAAKEAAIHEGVKVACLDFVKPSPYGTVWGLGGTCVNVGCIPKKLFHFGSTLRESIHLDSAAYGIDVLGQTSPDQMLTDPELSQHRWDTIRDNIQNYIKSLNFKYRVRLREKNVTYLNKLAKFVDKNTIEVTDKKGRSSTISSARFLIAVGGRPAPLECEGGELAISSDDIFSLDKNPGKTLCIGASYISLECAGFLKGLGLDVTVAVRSILLRGFDRECADKIDNFMVKQTGIKFKREVTPSKLEKVTNGDGEKIKVTFSDGTSDVYDTVLTAIGRIADTKNLGVENVNLQINPKNRKIIGKHEQSSCPNIYAVGDVLDGTPELTPVAIQAGIKLANRLFAPRCSKTWNEPMDYVNICTTVFTPIEYSCVGLSEEDAINLYGKENIEVYHREFTPLEWSMSFGRVVQNGFTKVIVEKVSIPNEEKVIGIHFVGPNAGEVLQGFGVSLANGKTLTFKELTNTVGIHPTSAEEITTLAVTKSSGEDAAAGGC